MDDAFTPNQTMPQLFLQRVAQHPDRVAMREKQLGVWTEVTWRKYQEHVEDVALGLLSLGVEKGDKVCIHGENSQEWLYADLGIQSAGALSVGIYPTNPPAEVQYIANHSDAKVYFAQDQEQTDKVLKVKDSLRHLQKIVTWDMRGLRNYQNPMLMSFKEFEERGRQLKECCPDLYMQKVNAGKPDDEALIVYTSGTTGPPKGAVHTHRSFLTGAKAMVDFFALNEGDRILSYLPLCHVTERSFSLAMPLFSGSVICFAENTNTVQRDLVEVGPTFIMFVPRILDKMSASIKIRIDDSSRLKRLLYKKFIGWGYNIADKKVREETLSVFWKILGFVGYWGLFRQLQDNLGLTKVRRALCGGAPVSPELIRYFRAIGVPIIQFYGQTEGLAVFFPTPDDIKYDTVGRNPLPGVDWKLSGDGETLWRWSGIIKGYYKDDQTTKQTIDGEGWLHSGDIGELDKDGHLKIVGRKKNIIITSGGKNITPEYIENKLKGSPYIDDAIVIGKAKPYLVALIQIKFEVVSHWAKSNRIPFTTLRDLSRNQAVIDLVGGVIENVNRELSNVEQIKKFCLIDVQLDHETGELTATMQVKRGIVEKKFAAEIAEMYGR